MNWRILVDGRKIEIDRDALDTVVEVEPGVYSVLLDGEIFEIRLLPHAGTRIAELNGRRVVVEVQDPRNATRGSRSAAGTGRQNITAPMPGKVVRVLVSEGDEVLAGQGLIVVEAMKMQNELKASRPGHVASIRARSGDTIAAGETLVVLE